MTAQQELRDLILGKLAAGQTPEQAADAIVGLFHAVDDEWTETDVSTVEDGPGTRYIDQRWVVARVPRESQERSRKADRSTLRRVIVKLPGIPEW